MTGTDQLLPAGFPVRRGDGEEASLPSNKATGSTTRPEHELLLLCVRASIGSQGAERIRTLPRRDIDWSYLIRTSLLHGVMPLLYRGLSSACPEAVSKSAMHQLRSHFYTNAYRNLALTQILLRLLDRFRGKGIPAVPLRGPVLSESVYGDLSLRQFGDIDILIRRQDAPRVNQLMTSHGYRLMHESSPKLHAAHEKHRHHCAFVQGADGPLVEIHWLIAPRYFCRPLDFQRVSERLVLSSLDGKDVSVLSPEDLLLVLCVHGSKHRWERVGWVCDVAKLASLHRGMRWQDVMSESEKLRCEQMLFLGLHLANDLFKVTVPKEVMQRVQADPVVKTLAFQARHRLFRDDSGRSVVLQPFLFRLRLQSGLLDKIRYCLGYSRAATSPTVLERELIPLPDSLFLLYYVIRPIRLIVKHGLRFPSRLR